jgi:hypothetical protein
MKRSTGTIVSAILAILGSVALLGLGGFIAILGIVMRANPAFLAQQQITPSPIPLTVVLFIECIVFLAFGVFGIIAAVGLLRLRNWARISFVVFAGMLCFFCIFGIFGTLVAMLVMPQMVPPDPNVPPGLLTAVFAFYLVLQLAVGGLAVWWLIYFTRRTVKEQFMSPAEAARPLRGPLSVTIIAWLLVVSGGLSVLYLPFSVPIAVFGIVLHGWMSRIVFLAFGAVSVIAGAGMLRWRPKAHSLAVAFYIFGAINVLCYFVIPGASSRIDQAMLEFIPKIGGSEFVSMRTYVRFGVLMGTLLSAIPLWLLITRRKAFLEACNAPPDSISPQSS